MAETKVAAKRKPGPKPGVRHGGRQKGTPNKSTASVKAAAQEYTDAALKTLAEIMNGAEQPAAARVAAANALLDRGYGKPAQAIVGGDDDEPPIKVARIELVGVRPSGDS